MRAADCVGANGTTMNLRIATIWTTKAMLLLTTAYHVYFAAFIPCAHITASPSFLWFSSAFPLIISFIIAKRLKHPLSLNILFYSTIAYTIWYVYILYEPLRNLLTYGYRMDSLDIFFVGFFSLPVMIPVWFAAVRMNQKYV